MDKLYGIQWRESARCMMVQNERGSRICTVHFIDNLVGRVGKVEHRNGVARRNPSPGSGKSLEVVSM